MLIKCEFLKDTIPVVLSHTNGLELYMKYVDIWYQPHVKHMFSSTEKAETSTSNLTVYSNQDKA